MRVKHLLSEKHGLVSNAVREVLLDPINEPQERATQT
jgi:hypothetical protein